ncbi:hypothetical protein N7447_007520 [Penicillium robsamsonii]|uniref:uncharacterized protein n=1 Tax=Penicillium robsamsonii TaxID=1792511 RepID=UPI0025489D23|nr:uncharacterized protein N7447_007520 [Penicillium robsamsonii]KAJ5817512.1 hypothetical protein N7447_007520 [Penicillium robsamsonii]
MSFSHPAKLKSVASGTEEKPPGAWAKHIKKLNYAAARQGSELKTPALRKLNEMPAKCELAVRNTSPFTPSNLERTISGNVNKVQSVLGYIVGKVADLLCECCERGMGPFPRCVILKDVPDMTACVGSSFTKNDKRCKEHHVPTEHDSNQDEQHGLDDTIAHIEVSCKKNYDLFIHPRGTRRSLHNSLRMSNPAGAPSSYESATENSDKLTYKPDH